MEQFWVFGYGSLIWRPGFEFLEREAGWIYGFRRRLCIYSHIHRGTPERPGLVLGLDRGGRCKGMGYRVAASRWDETLAYLREREQVTSVYLEVEITLHLPGTKRKVRAITYAADRSHLQYAGELGNSALVSLVRQGQGRSGACTDYVLNAVEHLRQLDIHDHQLESIAATLAE